MTHESAQHVCLLHSNIFITESYINITSAPPSLRAQQSYRHITYFYTFLKFMALYPKKICHPWPANFPHYVLTRCNLLCFRYFQTISVLSLLHSQKYKQKN